MPHRHPHHPVQRRCLSRIGAATSLALLLAACGGSDGSPPVISTQPQSLTVAEGGQGSVSVTATSDAGDITYQWFNVSGNANIVGATAASHAFGPVSLPPQAASSGASEVAAPMRDRQRRCTG